MKFPVPFMLLVLCSLIISGSLVLRGQSSANQSSTSSPQSLSGMEAAGVKMSFDAASVKPNKSGDRKSYSNVPLGFGAAYSPTGGLFSATNNQLVVYLAWAYDIPGDQFAELLVHPPNKILTENFDIEARAQGNATKQQMQLMMQSLLADRFKLMVHTETKRVPVYALEQSKPGKLGPQLRQNAEPCPTAPASGVPQGAPSPTSVATDFPTSCNGIAPMQASTSGQLRVGARDWSMEQFAKFFVPIINIKVRTGVDRPVVDRTGLNGTFDFALEFAPELYGPAPPDFQPDSTGPTFLEALKNQLGLKLEATTGPVKVYVIDHVEEPSPN